MPADMRRELFSLPDRGGNTFMSRPEGPGPDRRRRRASIAAGVGGAAGILGALGLSNMGKEEERV